MKHAGATVRSTGIFLTALAITAAPALSFGEFQVNTYTTDGQITDRAKNVAIRSDGSFVVVWQSENDGDGNSVQARIFDASATPVGTEFGVNTYTTGDQFGGAVSAAADGSFVVVWTSEYQDDGYSSGVFGQRFDALGAPVGTEFQVNTYTTSYQVEAEVASAPDGKFVVVWADFDQDANTVGVFGQRFDSGGAPLGTEFQVNEYTTGTQWFPAVSVADDGSFVAVWSHGVGVDDDVRGRRYDAAGAPAGTEFVVNSSTTGNEGLSDVSSAGDGSFVVVWTSKADGSAYSIEGRRFDSAGAPAGTAFHVNTYTTGYQLRSAVSAAMDGSFVVVWQSAPEENTDIQGQRYDALGAPIGTEFSLNEYTPEHQYGASVALADDGRFVAAWTSNEQDGDGDGVFGQRFGMCDSVPANGCLDGLKATIKIRNDADDTRDSIKWKLTGADGFDQIALGDPATSRAYSLCIYDETGDVPSLAATLTIDPNASWDDKDPKGFRYKDESAVEDGVTKASLKTGISGKAKVSVTAQGANAVMPKPISLSEYFAVDAAVTVQLVTRQASACWTSEFTASATKKNDPGRFSAKTP